MSAERYPGFPRRRRREPPDYARIAQFLEAEAAAERGEKRFHRGSLFKRAAEIVARVAKRRKW